jgi:hypothetical protein
VELQAFGDLAFDDPHPHPTVRPYASGLGDAWEIMVHGWKPSHFPDAEELFLYQYGFAPSTDGWIDTKVVREYGITGWWYRPVNKLKCMHGCCELDYDGEEDGMFRYSSITMVGQEVFRLFDQEKLQQR